MAKTANIHARMDEKIKNDAVAVFDALGLSVAEAITLYFRQVALQNKIPFELSAERKPKTNFERISEFKQDDLRKVIEALPESVDELWVFGSAVTPYCKPESDIDVCVIGNAISKADRKLIAHAPRGSMDLLDVSHQQFEAERDELGSIFYDVFHKGLLVYKKGIGLVNGQNNGWKT